MINLDNESISKIVSVYRLGKVGDIKEIKQGYVNYNLILRTDKGSFIVRIIGDELNKWKKRKLGMQFRLLTFLKKKGFPYEIPKPLKNKFGRYLLRLNNQSLWVYRKIQGKIYRNYNLNQFRGIAKCLVTYHKFVIDFRCREKDFFDFEWLFERYSEIRRIKPKNKLDKLVLKNISFFEHSLEMISEIDFTKSNLILTHSDFSNENLIFQYGNLKGILDFDNLQLAPVGKDIAIAVKRCNYLSKGFNKKKLNIFLNEYEKYFLLSDYDKKLIIPSLIKDNCSLFWWSYSKIRKGDENQRYKLIVYTIKETKRLVRSLSNNQINFYAK